MLIDDASIREVGRWPWSRAVIAEGLARLAAAGARTIGIDLLFAEAEPSAVPEVFRDRLRQALGDLGSFLDSLSGDAELAGQMRAAGNVVLPFSFGFGGPAAAELAGAARRRGGHRFSNRARTGHCPLDAPSVADQRARADP